MSDRIWPSSFATPFKSLIMISSEGFQLCKQHPQIVNKYNSKLQCKLKYPAKLPIFLPATIYFQGSESTENASIFNNA